MDRNAAQQAEYDARLEESRQSAARHSELLAAGERSQARQDTQLYTVDALIDRWTALADKVEELLDGSLVGGERAGAPAGS